MRLYFNGCSHTFGTDLTDQDQAWPVMLSKELGCDFVNDSISGGTNDRIKYRAIKYANDFDKFYLAWTYVSRFTRYKPNNHDVNFNSKLVHLLYASDWAYQQYGKLHYTEWYNELYAFKLWLQDIILVQRFFESIGKTCVMINSDNNHIDRWTVGWPLFNNSVKSLLCFDLMNDDQLYAEHIEIQSLIKQINFDRYIGWNTWWLTKMSEQYPVSSSGHLLEEGHKATAQYILKYDTN